MAATAFDTPYEEQAAKPPISVHPAFPAIVALWFAALLGLGSLVLPDVLLDRGVAMTDLASIIPAAAPPLGFTARGIIAIVGALIGAGLGLSIARYLASGHWPEPASRPTRLANGSPRPISVREELGGEGLVNGEALPINNRRAIAISEGDHADDFLYRESPAAEDFPGSAGKEPLELSELALDHAEMPAAGADKDCEMTDNPEFRSVLPSHHQRHPPESEPEMECKPVPASIKEPEFRADWETAPLDGLGLVQLVQRLGSTIERRRELIAQAAVAPVAVAAPFAAAPADFDPAPAEEAAQAIAAYFAPNSGTEVAEAVEPPPMACPELLGTFAEYEDGDADEGNDEGYSSLLGMSDPFAVPRNKFMRIEEPKPKIDLAEPAVVSSGQEEPAPAANARLFDPPGKAAAPSAPQPPADADAALRAALATLQRMSGAA